MHNQVESRGGEAVKKHFSSCDECNALNVWCVNLDHAYAGSSDICADCLIKAYQLLNQPTADMVDELHIDGETTAIDDVYLDGDTTTIDGASFKGILHELSASDMDCDVVQVEPFGGTATIHG